MTAHPKTVLITGANVGLGYDCARQLAALPSVTKIILACRNPSKAKAAKKQLEKETLRTIFTTLTMDVSNLDSVQTAVDKLADRVDGLVLNAGGVGGKDPGATTPYGVTSIFATNVLGHVLLVDEMIRQGKLLQNGKSTVVFSGSEAARGIPGMGFPRINITDGNLNTFVDMCDGEVAGSKPKTMETLYGPAKLMGALWMSSMARQYEGKIRFLTMSPGATSGTTFARDLSAVQRFMFMKVVFPILKAVGNAHSLEAGAKRYVDALGDSEKYKTGVFYGSRNGTSGKTADQTRFASHFANEQYQDLANEAIHTFLPSGRNSKVARPESAPSIEDDDEIEIEA